MPASVTADDCAVAAMCRFFFSPGMPRCADSSTKKRAHPDLNQGPADLQSAALTTELCTHLIISPDSFYLGDAEIFANPCKINFVLLWRSAACRQIDDVHACMQHSNACMVHVLHVFKTLSGTILLLPIIECKRRDPTKRSGCKTSNTPSSYRTGDLLRSLKS